MLEKVNQCPVCGSESRTLLYSNLKDHLFGVSGLWSMFRCSQCRCGYLSPRFSIDNISQAYNSYYTHATPKDTLNLHPVGWKKVWLKLRNGYFASQYGWQFPLKSSYGRFVIPFLPGRQIKCGNMARYLSMPKLNARLLDIGCGAGVFLRFAAHGGWLAEGLEPDENAAKAARSCGLTIQVGGLPETNYDENYFDAVTLNHVIEHLHDPIKGMQEVFRILCPGGLAVVSTPNLDSLTHKIYGRNWRGLEPPRHLVLFNGQSLQDMCERVGFEVQGLMPASPTARYYLWASEAIKRSAFNRPTLSTSGRFAFWILGVVIDLISKILPRREEELVLLIKKPLV